MIQYNGGKLVKRFFEPLMLLAALGQVQGERIAEGPLGLESTDANAIMQRRRILSYLCAMCDFRRGGETVTAMAVEEHPAGPVYWLAANGPARSRIMDFLEEILHTLGSAEHGNSVDDQVGRLEDDLFIRFTKFNRPRLASTWLILQKSIREEMDRLSILPSNDDQSNYQLWLESFKQPIDDPEALSAFCRTAYEARNSHFIDYMPGPEHESKFSLRHYVGRMGSTLRAAKFLALVAANHPAMFENFDIRLCYCGGPSPGPRATNRLTFEGIAARMLPANSPRLGQLVDALYSLDLTIKLRDRILERYQSPSFKPKVHAELAVLEAVYSADIEFYGGDKFIACSKGACFCCYHYIHNHPGLFVLPPSHNKVYTNWRAPDLQTPDEEDSQKRQRDVMNKLIAEVRKAAMERVLKRSGAYRWHSDSTTGITPAGRSLFVSGMRAGGMDRMEDRGPLSTVDGASEADSIDGGVSLITSALSFPGMDY